ncbi:MAG: hypothetical protein ACRD0Y_10340 [Terriglobales bacterium]
MLVYANHFVVLGEKAPEAIFKAVGAWLKKQLGRGLRPDQLRSAGEFEGERDRGGAKSYLRIYADVSASPELYAWVLKHPDEQARGRQWSTEIGLEVNEGTCTFSCVLETDDPSTLTGAQPVIASQPGVVAWAVRNIIACAHFDDSVPGLSPLSAGADLDSYEGLRYELGRKARNHPIVLVSPTNERKYLINPNSLQEQLVGLAQVVRLTPGFNSYDLAASVGEQFSAWSGAVNIISAPFRDGNSRSYVLRSRDIEEWGGSEAERCRRLFAIVTDRTNIPHLRHRIRPDRVMRVRLTRQLQQARATGGSQQVETSQLRTNVEEYAQLLEQADADIQRLGSDIQSLQHENDDLHAELSDAKRDKEALRNHLDNSSKLRAESGDPAVLLKALCEKDAPGPAQCLSWLQQFFPASCVVLESAFKSARASSFADGRKLLDLLLRLVVDYRQKLVDGNGDVEARTVFGRNEFSAVESDSVMKSPKLRRSRIFEYDGEPMEMLAHVKIGVDDNAAKLIRVHFGWDPARQVIVIGHCGKHLPILSH